jgi:antitoxin (DNA-binding transcriptional repressor) of toxin-antitoxin stability system
MTNRPAAKKRTPAPAKRERVPGAPIRALTMRELGKLTVEQVATIDHPVPVTSNGSPVAWLVPLTPAERRRAELIAAGRLEPRRREDLDAWESLPSVEAGESTLTEILEAMRGQERS